MIRSAAVLAFLALDCSTFVSAYPPSEKRGGSVCSSGIYGELAPILAPYPIAQAFCSAFYPVSCTTAVVVKRHTTTTTVTTRSTSSPSTTKTTSVSTTKTTSTKATTTTVDKKASAWAKCQGQGPQVVSTLCSCIEVPKACAAKTSTSTTKSTNTETNTGKTTGTSTGSGTSSTTSTSTSTSSSISTSISSSTSASTITSTSSSTSVPSSTSTGASSLPTACSQLAPSGSGTYTAVNDDTFNIQCGYYRTSCHENTLNGLTNDGGYASSFRDCLDQCSTTPTCEFIQWYGQSFLCQLETSTDCGGEGPYDGYDRASLQLS